MRIDSCCTRTPVTGCCREKDLRTTRETERLLVASASQQSDASLRVVTDDGDVVTLTAHQESSAAYTDYRRSVRGPEGAERQRIQVFEASSQESFSIEIEGTLDDEERADLEALIQRVATSFRRFEQGDDAGAQALLQGAGDLESLESFAVHFEREQTVTVGELIRRTQAIGEREERAALPPTQPTVAPLPVTPAITEAVPVPRPGVQPQPVEPTSEAPREASPHEARHRWHRGRSLHRAAQVVDRLLDKLASDRRGFDVEKAVSAIRAALVQSAPGQPAPVSLPVTESPISVTDTA